MLENISKFIEEVNSKLGSVIEIVEDNEREYPCFELILCKTNYVMRDQVVLNMDSQFGNLIKDMGKKYFKI